MNFPEAIASGFRNYVGFTGRASRSEFWYWSLFAVLVSIVATIIDAVIGMTLLNPITSLALFLPGLAVNVRRLHDLDHSGWWFLLLLFVWAAVGFWRGTIGENRFGQDPLAHVAI
jgi:uncharacterized membrane protein YhaH (DUF805 family)